MQPQTDTSILFEPYKLGDLALKNRFIVGGSSRRRCDIKTLAPTSAYPEHYSLRASAGLVISEGLVPANNAYSFAGCAGIFTQEQIDGWKKVVEAVHAKGGLIMGQVWHAGRMCHSSVMGEKAFAPSAISIHGEHHDGIPHEEPKEMSKEDIRLVLEQYRQAIKNIKEAGFDGVQINAFNGYLLDTFIRDGANKRTDEYGGSVENRCRLILEVVDIAIEIFGKGLVGVKLSPVSRANEIYDSDPLATYSYLMKEFDNRGVSHVELQEPASNSQKEGDWESPLVQMPEVCKALRPFYKGAIIINGEQTPEKAAQAIREGTADLVCFGKNFISNPDYVERVKNNWPLNAWDPSTFFSGGEKGFNDYPLYVPK